MLIVVNNGVRVEEKGDEKRDGDGCVEPVVLCIFHSIKSHKSFLFFYNKKIIFY